MVKRKPQKKKKVATPDDIDDIMGQWFYALGEGAGSMRITRAAIRATRGRYKPFIEAALKKDPNLWDTQGPQVLHYVKVTGKLASYLSFKDGYSFIDHRRVIVAAKKIEKRANETLKEIHVLGAFCPPPIGPGTRRRKKT